MCSTEYSYRRHPWCWLTVLYPYTCPNAKLKSSPPPPQFIPSHPQNKKGTPPLSDVPFC